MWSKYIVQLYDTLKELIKIFVEKTEYEDNRVWTQVSLRVGSCPTA